MDNHLKQLLFLLGRNIKEKNVVLYEDDLVLITQATGSPVKGYLMIVTKRHINEFAELSKEKIIVKILFL